MMNDSQGGSNIYLGDASYKMTLGTGQELDYCKVVIGHLHTELTQCI